MITQNNIIFFDGECNFCNSTVNFIFRNNTKKNIFYSSLQSNFSKNFFQNNKKDLDLSTIYFYTNGKLYDRSSAVLKLTKELKNRFKLLYIFLVVPKFLRDLVYRIIAKNRHKLYTKKVSCLIPTDSDDKYFLNELSDLKSF